MRYSTTTPTSSLRREVDRIFDTAFAPIFGRDLVSSVWVPAADVRETEQAVVIELEIPGVRPESVDVTTDRGILRIRGEKTASQKPGDHRVHIAERVLGAFERAFRLPKGLDEGAITAEFDHGVLRVHLPKSALPQPRRIDVRVADRSAIGGGSTQPAWGGQATEASGNGASVGGDQDRHTDR